MVPSRDSCSIHFRQQTGYWCGRQDAQSAAPKRSNIEAIAGASPTGGGHCIPENNLGRSSQITAKEQEKLAFEFDELYLNLEHFMIECKYRIN